jgi:PAS domain S-box-containing protein
MPLPNNFIPLPSLAEIVNRSPIMIHPDLSVADAVALMSQAQGSHCELWTASTAMTEAPSYLQQDSCVLVTEGRKLQGILTERDIVRLTAQQQDLTSTRVGAVMTRDIVTLVEASAQTALTVLPLFQQHRIRHLPIVDTSGDLVGLVTPDLLRQILQPANLLKLRSIAEVMTTTVIHAPATASVLSIARQMATHSVSCVVITAEITAATAMIHPPTTAGGALWAIGMITERDIVQFQTLGVDLDRMQADTVMSSPVFTLDPAASLWRAQQEMNTRRINRLVVTDGDGRMLGIVTQTSLLQPLDPIEVLGLVDILHQQVQAKTAALEQSNQELRQARDRLEREVAARTSELSSINWQLQQEIQHHQQTEADLRDFVENAVIGLHWVGEDGTILWANQAELDLLGYTREEYIGHSIEEFHLDAEIIEDILQRLLSDRPVRDYEARLRCKDGSICHVLIDSSTSRKDGKFSHTRCFTRNISDRKSTEDALRQSERKFRAIFDGTFQFVGLLDTDGIVLEANSTALNAIGATSEQVIGQLFWETPWWTHSPALQIQLKQGITQAAIGQLVRFEARHFLADGSYITVDFSLSPIFDETGKVVMLIPEGRDISDRKAAEHLIIEQAMLLNITTDAIMVRDLANRVRFWNSSAERIYGWSALEVIDRDANSLFYPDPSPAAVTALATVLQQGEWQGELEKLTKTGQTVIAQSRWTLVRDEEGQPKEILVVDTDITEKKQLEAQFLRAQRLESLGTLASGIAHDMNNVLTPILAASQLLPMRLKHLDDRSQSLLRMLEESAKRGTALVQQILSFARGSDGSRNSIQIRHTLSEVVRVARQTFPKSIDISLNLATTDLWLIFADPTQLHQVLMNLTINARDAMPDGGNLTIAAENLILDQTDLRLNLDAKIGPYVVLTVADTGAGIAPEILERIFDPFFTTKAPGKGTGLGLSTTLSIVKSHGGFVSVHSDVGQGTRFKIYLPAEESVQTDREIETLELPLGNGESILVVDDELSVREIIKASLEAYNYQVVTASDGLEAIARYAERQSEIQVILLDLMMPSLDSASTIRALQRIDPNVSIVVMSGLSATEPIKNMSDINVQAFLAKPFTSQALLQTLQQIHSIVPS